MPPGRARLVYPGVVKIETGKRVRLRVHLAVVDGETIEKKGIEYVHGGGKMLPGLETVLDGLEAGAKKEGVLKDKDAFGNPALSPTKKMKRTEFPKDAQLEAGQRFMAKSADNGLDVLLEVQKVTSEDVEVRLLHPLADKDIRYEVEVLNVTDPAPPPVPGAALKLDES